eukprot:scaffold4663_cov104-Isochrysis_galbana.AAC.11
MEISTHSLRRRARDMVHNRKATPEPHTIDHSFAAVTFRAFPAPCLFHNLAAPEACEPSGPGASGGLEYFGVSAAHSHSHQLYSTPAGLPYRRCARVAFGVHPGIRLSRPLVSKLVFAGKAGHCERDHLDGLDRVVAHGLDLRDGLDHVHALHNGSENGVLGLAAREPIEERVVSNIQKELRAARIGPAGVGHRQRARLVGVLGDVLIQNVAAVAPLLCLAGGQVLERAVGRASSARAGRLGVLAVRATELVHKATDNAMEVQPVVETRIGQIYAAHVRPTDAADERQKGGEIWFSGRESSSLANDAGTPTDEVARRPGHTVQIDLGGECAHGGFEFGDRVGADKRNNDQAEHDDFGEASASFYFVSFCFRLCNRAVVADRGHGHVVRALPQKTQVKDRAGTRPEVDSKGDEILTRTARATATWV